MRLLIAAPQYWIVQPFCAHWRGARAMGSPFADRFIDKLCLPALACGETTSRRHSFAVSVQNSWRMRCRQDQFGALPAEVRMSLHRHRGHPVKPDCGKDAPTVSVPPGYDARMPLVASWSIPKSRVGGSARHERRRTARSTSGLVWPAGLLNDSAVSRRR